MSVDVLRGLTILLMVFVNDLGLDAPDYELSPLRGWETAHTCSCGSAMENCLRSTQTKIALSLIQL